MTLKRRLKKFLNKKEVVNFWVGKQQATEAAYSNFYCYQIIELKVFKNDN